MKKNKFDTLKNKTIRSVEFDRLDLRLNFDKKTIIITAENNDLSVRVEKLSPMNPDNEKKEKTEHDFEWFLTARIDGTTFTVSIQDTVTDVHLHVKETIRWVKARTEQDKVRPKPEYLLYKTGDNGCIGVTPVRINKTVFSKLRRLRSLMSMDEYLESIWVRNKGTK